MIDEVERNERHLFIKNEQKILNIFLSPEIFSDNDVLHTCCTPRSS